MRAPGASYSRGAAAAYHQSGGIGIPLFNQVACAVDAVLDVDDAPLPLEPKPICPSVSGAAPIVHVEHADAPAGPILHRKRERARGGRGRPSVDLDEDRNLLAFRPSELGGNGG